MTTAGVGSACRRGRRRGGFTFVDLMACLLIVCLTAGLLFGQGVLARTREAGDRIKCQSNLRQIGMAMLMYTNENKGMYPRTIFGSGQPLTQYTGATCKNPFGKDGAPKANDVTAALFLLLRTQDVTPELFVCPSTALKPVQPGPGKTLQDMGNFPSEEHLSYSMTVPYPDWAAVQRGYQWDSRVAAEFAMAADMNPGNVGEYDVTPAKGPRDENAPPEAMRRANSMNHEGAGQNVLFADGTVRFAVTPFVGMKRDNIYTVSGSPDGGVTTSRTVAGLPTWRGDSVLLPAATKAPARLTAEERDAADTEVARKSLEIMKGQLREGERRMELLRREIAATEALLAERERRRERPTEAK